VNKPIRIQRKRTKGWRKPANSVIVDRTSRWGNPFKVGETFKNSMLFMGLFTKDIKEFKEYIKNGIYVKDARHAIKLYRRLLNIYTAEKIREHVAPLKGKNLICFCKLSDSCHADVLLKLANN